MKTRFLFSWGIIVCFCISCSKNGIATNTSSRTDTVTVPVTTVTIPVKIDSLPFPLTMGTWWKYQRVDTATSGSVLGPNKPITDSSTEIITLIGKIKITDSVQGFMMEVRNLSKNKKDTNYLFYYRSNCIVTNSFPPDITQYADSNFLAGFDLRFRLPLREGKYSIYNIYRNPFDSVVIKKDTTLSVLNKIYPNCSYQWEDYSLYGGAFSNSASATSVLIKNIGFAYWQTGAGNSNHYGLYTNNWFVRRLLDYYIAP